MEISESHRESILQKVSCFVENCGGPQLIFEAVTNTSQLLVVAWPDIKEPRSDRPLKRTYAVAGQFIEDHSIGQTLTVIARSGGLHFYSEADEMEKI